MCLSCGAHLSQDCLDYDDAMHTIVHNILIISRERSDRVDRITEYTDLEIRTDVKILNLTYYDDNL